MIRNFLTVMGVLLCAASPALSATCNFTTECLDGDGCSDSTFSVELEGDGDNLRMVTDAQTIGLSQGGNSDTQIYIGITETAFHILTATQAGPSRYTTHIYNGPLIVSYIGECAQ